MQPTNPEDCSKFSARLCGAAFDTLSATWPWLAFPVFPQDGRPLRVLHLGCGNGDVTIRVLAPWYPETVQVVGADPDATMVRHALLHCLSPGMFYTQADIAEPYFSQTTLWKMGPFSQIFSFNYVKSLSPESVPINWVRHLLAPGGVAVLTVLSSPLYNTYRLLATDRRFGHYMQDLEDYVSPYQISQANHVDDAWNLWCIQFALLDWILEKHVSFVFSSEAELKEYLIAIDPFIHRMPKEESESYIGHVVSLCRSLCGVSARNGYHRISFSRLTVVIRKT